MESSQRANTEADGPSLESKDERMSHTTLSASENPVDVEREASPVHPPADGNINTPPTKAKVTLSMFALCMAVFLAALDSTIISTILPTIANDLDTTDYGWIGSTYLLAAAAVIPCWGKISDIFGRKPILLIANCLFLAGSLICALSINIGMLLAGRTIQGAGAGSLTTLVNICISDMFSMRDRGMYMGFIGLVFAFASAIGPVIGGAFVSVSWRWGFWINLPFDGIALIMITMFLHLETPKTPLIDGLKAIDWAGCFSIISGVTLFLLGLSLGGIDPWNSATVVTLLVFGIILMMLFTIVEGRFAKYPIIPMRVLTIPSNIAALLCIFAHGFVLMSGTFYLPVYFQLVLDASSVLSGAYLLPYLVALSVVGMLSGVYMKSTGNYRPLIIFGLGCLVLGYGLFIDLQIYPSWPRVIIYQIIAAVGVGCLFQSPLVALQAHVDPQDIGSITGAFGFVRQLSTAMAVVMCNTIFQNELSKQILAPSSGLPPTVVVDLADGSIGKLTELLTMNETSVSTKQTLIGYAASSLRTVWTVCTVIAFVGFLISWLIRPKKLSTTHTTTKVGLEAQKTNKEIIEAQKLAKQNQTEEK